VYHLRGPKFFPDPQNFLEDQTTFPYITTLTTILPDCLCLPNKLGAFWLFDFLISHSSPDLCWTFARLFDFVIFLGGGQLPPLPPVPYAYEERWNWIAQRKLEMFRKVNYSIMRTTNAQLHSKCCIQQESSLI
jgi:hypothetical protein